MVMIDRILSNALMNNLILLKNVILFSAFISGCSMYPEVYTSSDNTIDFNKYKTFAWLPDRTDTLNSPYNNEIIRNNLRNYVGQCLAERGYKLNLDTPDVLVQAIIKHSVERKEVYFSSYPWTYYYNPYYLGSIYYFPYGWNYYYHWHHMYYMPSDYYVSTVEFREGSITINLIDRRENKLVWSGTARGNIYDPSYINRSIHPAVEAILSKYPIAPISPNSKKYKNGEREQYP
jgi:Domain of unknown function (DUF4136)